MFPETDETSETRETYCIVLKKVDTFRWWSWYGFPLCLLVLVKVYSFSFFVWWFVLYWNSSSGLPWMSEPGAIATGFFWACRNGASDYDSAALFAERLCRCSEQNNKLKFVGQKGSPPKNGRGNIIAQRCIYATNSNPGFRIQSFPFAYYLLITPNALLYVLCPLTKPWTQIRSKTPHPKRPSLHRPPEWPQRSSKARSGR